MPYTYNNKKVDSNELLSNIKDNKKSYLTYLLNIPGLSESIDKIINNISNNIDVNTGLTLSKADEYALHLFNKVFEKLPEYTEPIKKKEEYDPTKHGFLTYFGKSIYPNKNTITTEDMLLWRNQFSNDSSALNSFNNIITNYLNENSRWDLDYKDFNNEAYRQSLTNLLGKIEDGSLEGDDFSLNQLGLLNLKSLFNQDLKNSELPELPKNDLEKQDPLQNSEEQNPIEEPVVDNTILEELYGGSSDLVFTLGAALVADIYSILSPEPISATIAGLSADAAWIRDAIKEKQQENPDYNFWQYLKDNPWMTAGNLGSTILGIVPYIGDAGNIGKLTSRVAKLGTKNFATFKKVLKYGSIPTSAVLATFGGKAAYDNFMSLLDNPDKMSDWTVDNWKEFIQGMTNVIQLWKNGKVLYNQGKIRNKVKGLNNQQYFEGKKYSKEGFTKAREFATGYNKRTLASYEYRGKRTDQTPELRPRSNLFTKLQDKFSLSDQNAELLESVIKSVGGRPLGWWNRPKSYINTKHSDNFNNALNEMSNLGIDRAEAEKFLSSLGKYLKGGILKGQNGFLIPEWYINLYLQKQLDGWSSDLDDSLSSNSIKAYRGNVNYPSSLYGAYSKNNEYIKSGNVGKDIQNYITLGNFTNILDAIEAYNKDAASIRSFWEKEHKYNESGVTAHNLLFNRMFKSRGEGSGLDKIGYDANVEDILGTNTWMRRMDRYETEFDINNPENTRMHEIALGKDNFLVYKKANGDIALYTLPEVLIPSTSIETPETPATVKTVETPQTVETPADATTPSVVQTPEAVETPQTVKTVKTVKTPETVKTVETDLKDPLTKFDRRLLYKKIKSKGLPTIGMRKMPDDELEKFSETTPETTPETTLESPKSNDYIEKGLSILNAFGTLRHNAEQYKLSRRLTPLLYRPYETHRRVYGDLKALSDALKAFAILNNLASRSMTSDGALQTAAMLDSYSSGYRNYLSEGQARYNDLYRKTAELAQAVEDANIERRYNTAMKNLENIDLVTKEQLASLMSKKRADYESIKNLIDEFKTSFVAKRTELDKYNDLKYQLVLYEQMVNNPQLFITDMDPSWQDVWERYRSGEKMDTNEQKIVNRIELAISNEFLRRKYPKATWQVPSISMNNYNLTPGTFTPVDKSGGKITKDMSDAIIKYLKESNKNYNEAMSRHIKGMYNHIKLQRKKK